MIEYNDKFGSPEIKTGKRAYGEKTSCYSSEHTKFSEFTDISKIARDGHKGQSINSDVGKENHPQASLNQNGPR